MHDHSTQLLPVEYQQEYDKIRPITEQHAYTLELLNQCRSALDCFEMMVQLRNYEIEAPVLLTLAHAFLTFAGNVSKILTPRSKHIAQQLQELGEVMCKEMNLDASDLDSILDPRNSLEHFHERMHKYLRNHSSRPAQEMVIFQSVVHATEDGWRRFGVDSKPVFYKLLISSTWAMTICGQTYDLVRIRELIEAIMPAARRSFDELELRLEEGQRHLETMFDLDGFPPRLRSTPAA